MNDIRHAVLQTGPIDNCTLVIRQSGYVRRIFGPYYQIILSFKQIYNDPRLFLSPICTNLPPLAQRGEGDTSTCTTHPRATA